MLFEGEWMKPSIIENCRKCSQQPRWNFNDYFEHPFSIGCHRGCGNHVNGDTPTETATKWNEQNNIKPSRWWQVDVITKSIKRLSKPA